MKPDCPFKIKINQTVSDVCVYKNENTNFFDSWKNIENS